MLVLFVTIFGFSFYSTFYLLNTKSVQTNSNLHFMALSVHHLKALIKEVLFILFILN